MKHAVVMMAHNNTSVVRSCFRILDDDRFVYYLLIDKKSDYDTNDFLPELKHASVKIIERINLNWGGWSLTKGFFSALRETVRDGCDYIHYLQGADLPLKTPEQIDAFFTKNNGKEYIDFSNAPPYTEETMIYRALCKHYLTDNRLFRHSKIVHALNYAIARPQMPLAKQRARSTKIYVTSALFSISKEFGLYLVNHYKEIEKMFRYTYVTEELWPGTVFMNSPFRDSLADPQITRFIDWERREGSSPRTFSIEDWNEIKEAMDCPNMCFARKFSENRDMQVVNAIENALLGKTIPGVKQG